MTRPYWIVLALVCGACNRPAPSGATLLPAKVGDWQRNSLRDIPAGQPGVVRAFEAGYADAGQLTVDLYEAKVAGTAFEMTQHWRATPDAVFFDKGRYFAVVKWQQADRKALTDFVRALEKELADLER